MTTRKGKSSRKWTSHHTRDKYVCRLFTLVVGFNAFVKRAVRSRDVIRSEGRAADQKVYGSIMKLGTTFPAFTGRAERAKVREPQRQTSGLLADRLSFSAVIELSAGPVLCSSARSLHIGGVPTSSGDGANLGGGPPPRDVSLVFSTRFELSALGQV